MRVCWSVRFPVNRDDDTIVYVAVGQGIGSGIYHKERDHGEGLHGASREEIGHTRTLCSTVCVANAERAA